MSGPLSSSSTSFSFNFDLSESNEQVVPNSSNNVSETDTGICPTQNIVDRPRLPFKWMNDAFLKASILERSKQALVYSDIPLVDHDALEEVGNPMLYANEAILPSPRVTDDVERDVDETELPSHQAPTKIRCVDLSLSSFHSKSLNEETSEHVDIVPGIYEGGRQVWECSRDLLHYMVQNRILLHDVVSTRQLKTMSNVDALSIEENLASKQCVFALELGCGHGLPGIYLLRQALQRSDEAFDFKVCFTDYNEGVLRDATLSNIVLNCVNEISEEENGDKYGSTLDNVAKHVVLGGGDWLDMSHQLQNSMPDRKTSVSMLPPDGYFDLILAAETIYSLSAARETALLLKRHLRPESGVAFVASKRYYFGVGGGVDVFRDSCANVVDDSYFPNRRAVQLIVNSVKVLDNGTGNIREILQIQSVIERDTI